MTARQSPRGTRATDDADAVLDEILRRHHARQRRIFRLVACLIPLQGLSVFVAPFPIDWEWPDVKSPGESAWNGTL